METGAFINLGELCKKLNIKSYKIIYLLQQMIIPEPNRIGGRRTFSEEDIKKIQQILEKRNKHQNKSLANKKLINEVISNEE